MLQKSSETSRAYWDAHPERRRCFTLDRATFERDGRVYVRSKGETVYATEEAAVTHIQAYEARIQQAMDQFVKAFEGKLQGWKDQFPAHARQLFTRFDAVLRRHMVDVGTDGAERSVR